METFFLGLFTILFGAVVGLAGYQLYRVLLPIWGLIAGFIWGAHIVDVALGEGFLATITGWGVGAAMGIAGAILAYAFYQAAVAILVGLIGFFVTYGLSLQLGAQEGGVLVALMSLLVAAALGVMTIYFRVPKAILMGLTAFSGATAVIGGVLVMSGQIGTAALGTTLMGDIISGSVLWSITWASLAVLGVVSQALLDRNIREQLDQDQDYAGLESSTMAGALGGEVEKEQNSYNQFEDDEVESVQDVRNQVTTPDDPHDNK